MLRYLAPLGVIAILIVVFSIGLTRDPSELPSTYIDKQAPGFDLPKVKAAEQRIASADYAGETVLVNVWATWCVGCRQEHDFLMQLAQHGRHTIVLDNAATIYDADMATQALGLFKIMGRQDDRRTLLIDTLQKLPHGATDLDIHAGGRLIQDQDR